MRFAGLRVGIGTRFHRLPEPCLPGHEFVRRIRQYRADLEKIAVAAVFHDLGIWTNKTFDYVAPSVALAGEYLPRKASGVDRRDRDDDRGAPQITGSAANPASLVEPFRRADWIDVTRGVRTFGVPRQLIESVFTAWPSAGFHWRLVTLAVEGFGRIH